jgi:hypothetical protein
VKEKQGRDGVRFGVLVGFPCRGAALYS